MSGFEYKVVPAPMRGLKAKGVKGTPARFANALESVMNAYGAEGWEYVRTDTLPSEERTGLTGRTTVYQNMMVFRKAVVTEAPAALLPAPEAAPITSPAAQPEPEQMMSVENKPLEADPARTEPKLTAD